MGKQNRRRAAAAAAAPKEPKDESNAVIGEAEMLRDEIDTELLERDTIRFEGDSDASTEDGDLQTEQVLELPSEGEEEEEEDTDEDELRERAFEEVEDELRVTDKAWGKKKSAYYNDNEEEISSADEEELEEEEEREAMVLQKRLMSHLSAQDFDTSRFIADASDTVEKETVLKTDFTSMSKDEKLMHLLQNSPELPEMLEEFRDKLSEAKEPLYPLLQMGRQKGTFSDTGHNYIEAKYKLNLLYCLNIGYYLMLHNSPREEKEDLKNHPVIERIVTMRNMYKTCAKTDCTLEQEIEHLLNVEEEKEEEEEETKKRKNPSSDGEEVEEDLYEKHKKLNEQKKSKKKKRKGIAILPEDPTVMEEGEDKRGITYKIMKNKGLTPHRTKEQRNPRVKHRKKFEKALKKRRSQIPDARKQEGAYGGEKSGIKSGLTKGTVLK